MAPRATIATDDGGGIDQAVASEQLVSRVKAANAPSRALGGVAAIDRLLRTSERAVATIVAEANPIVVAVATTATSNR